MTAGLVGVDLDEGDARGGEPWGSGAVCSCGVCTGGALPPCAGVGGWEERLGLPAYVPFTALGGRPRFRGLPSSARAVSGLSGALGGCAAPCTYHLRRTAGRHSCSRASDCASGRARVAVRRAAAGPRALEDVLAEASLADARRM